MNVLGTFLINEGSSLLEGRPAQDGSIVDKI
jgi:hypothetical protein